MKNFILGIAATIMCCVFEAKAANISCINGLREDKTTTCDKCGDNCDWEIKDGVLKVSGSGSMYDYDYLSSGDKPWRGYEADINHLTIEGISNIGSGAFSSFRNLSSAEMDNSVKNVGIQAFAWTGLSSVKMSDSVSSLGYEAFRGTNLTEIELPSGVIIGRDALGEQQISVICKGSNEDCEQLRTALDGYVYIAPYNTSIAIPMSLGGKMKLAQEGQCNSEVFYWTGEFCHNRPTDGSIIDCAEGYFANTRDLCEKIKLRYTLPEADAATSDDNENMIEWIFE